MYRNIAEYSNLFLNGNNNSFNFMMPFILFAVIFILFYSDAFSQWINNPSLNTELVSDASDPINILSVRDLNGGAFVFWQDNKSGFQNEVYFVRVNGDGRVNQTFGQPSLKPEGRKISSLTGPEENPACSNEISNSAIVVWTDYTNSRVGNLFTQRLLSDGKPAWTDKGLQLTNGEDEISGYSVCSDNSGSSFIAYISKDPEINSAYKIELQKISLDGKFLFEQHSVLVQKSKDRKSMTTVVPDNDGGVYVFWVDTQNSRNIIMAQHVFENGKIGWEDEALGQHDRAVEVSGSTQNIITYAAKSIDSKSIYIAWQIQRNSKDIYHQLIDTKGRSLWGRGGKQVTTLKGNQFNPQTICSDTSIILSWTNEQSHTNRSDIYIQKYNFNGKPLWNKSGIPVIKYRGEQFGQHLISDGKGGVIISWVDRRDESAYADIYAQRIDYNGRTVWDSLGVPVALNHNSPKSYLSLIPDNAGGAVVIFKNRRNNKNKIYGQKIFSSGNFISQIGNVNTTLTGDSIKISWNSDARTNDAKYDVERAAQARDGNFEWHVIGMVSSSNQNNLPHYAYYDVPTVTGTLYYRITQTDSKGNAQKSDISRINYFGNSPDVILTQNIPNPFADSTVISFYLPEPTMVEIEFFNDHVEKISELDKPFPSGENSITFYSKGLKPGIYFYRLKVDNFVDVKKMIITN